MEQLMLLQPIMPPLKERLTLVCGDASLACYDAQNNGGAHLTWIDAPWEYRNTGGKEFHGCAKGQYDTASQSSIVDIVEAAYDAALDDTYAVIWWTFPLLDSFIEVRQATRWKYITGGAWLKKGAPGVGTHLRGNAEAVALFGKGEPRPAGKCQPNGWHTYRGEHSQKPVEVASDLLRHLTPIGAFRPRLLVPYAGLDPIIPLALSRGYDVFGAELDPQRHHHAMTLAWRHANG